LPLCPITLFLGLDALDLPPTQLLLLALLLQSLFLRRSHLRCDFRSSRFVGSLSRCQLVPLRFELCPLLLNLRLTTLQPPRLCEVAHARRQNAERSRRRRRVRR
jgi:hypothetical protein